MGNDAEQPGREDRQSSAIDLLTQEILQAVDESGKLKACVAKHLSGSKSSEEFDQACLRVAERLLADDPPQTGCWEQLLVALAIHAHHDSRQHRGLNACRAIVEQLKTAIQSDVVPAFNAHKAIAVACVLMVVLSAQDKLTQDIEQIMRLLADKFPGDFPALAEECQGIWMRRGQMSGRPGLFLWDTVRQEWRLAQDFKPYRPGK